MLLTGGGATAYNDGGLATGRAAQGGGDPGVSFLAFVQYTRCTRVPTMSGSLPDVRMFVLMCLYWMQGQAGNMPGMPAKMQSKMDEVKNKVMEQGEKQKQANQ